LLKFQHRVNLLRIFLCKIGPWYQSSLTFVKAWPTQT